MNDYLRQLEHRNEELEKSLEEAHKEINDYKTGNNTTIKAPLSINVDGWYPVGIYAKNVSNTKSELCYILQKDVKKSLWNLFRKSSMKREYLIIDAVDKNTIILRLDVPSRTIYEFNSTESYDTSLIRNIHIKCVLKEYIHEEYSVPNLIIYNVTSKWRNVDE